MRHWHVIITIWPLPWSWHRQYWRNGKEINISFGPFQVETMRD